ncbi:MAG: NADH-ubiquinone oxidoreductase-F iron-sulfur binding region domain-containing protein [Nitrososphaerales archaeon]
MKKLTRPFDEIRKQAVEEWNRLWNDGRAVIRVESATCGRAAGVLQVADAVQKKLQELNIDAKIVNTGCIGLCYLEPIMDVTKPNQPSILYHSLDPKTAASIVEDYLVKNDIRADKALCSLGSSYANLPSLAELPVMQKQTRWILQRCGLIDPEKIEHYIALGGYSGLVKALSMKPHEVIEWVKLSRLRGRGGAGFPTGKKWEVCRSAPGDEKYIICNADEGDPGAFMNRALLESDPHFVLEGMVIGSYALGAQVGYIYCRAEYPLALERLRTALKQMADFGFLGKDILGSGHNFEIRIKEGAGAFVCGEETALIASIEGKRGMPRPRPPYPAQSGLWGKPTVINNVETWACISLIFQKGWEYFANKGSESSKGTKTFSLVGKVKRAGLIEVPLGITLKEIIYDIGGGIIGDKEFKAVQIGGPSGGCLPKVLLTTPVDYDSLSSAGSIMGSGGIVVMDEDTCVVDIAHYFLDFTQKESCGKCVVCREGTWKMLQLLKAIKEGRADSNTLAKLEDLAQIVKIGSLCGLGQTAPNPVLTTLRYFRDEYEAHINEKRCPAKVCKNLITYYIIPDKCEGCMICLRECPSGAIRGGKRMVHIIDQEKCSKCGVCYNVCPPRFRAVVKVSGEHMNTPSEPIPVQRRK